MLLSFAWCNSSSLLFGPPILHISGPSLAPTNTNGCFLLPQHQTQLVQWGDPTQINDSKTVVTDAKLMAESSCGQMTQLHQWRCSLWEGATSKGHLRWNPGSNGAWEEFCYWLQRKQKFILGEEPLLPHFRALSKTVWVWLTSSVACVGHERPKTSFEDIMCLSFEDTQFTLLFDAVWSGYHLQM